MGREATWTSTDAKLLAAMRMTGTTRGCVGVSTGGVGFGGVFVGCCAAAVPQTQAATARAATAVDVSERSVMDDSGEWSRPARSSPMYNPEPMPGVNAQASRVSNQGVMGNGASRITSASVFHRP
jgi:hypothetical protein